MMRDADFGIVRVRAFGTSISGSVDPKIFLKEVAGSDHHFRLDEFADTMRSRIVSLFSEALGRAKVPVLTWRRYVRWGSNLPVLNAATMAKIRNRVCNFRSRDVSVPPEVEQAIDKRSSMAAVGNLNDYVIVPNGGGTRAWGRRPAGSAAEIAMGFGMATR
jgi:membrane protease subunit (stomatin/prohibitin family)